MKIKLIALFVAMMVGLVAAPSAMASGGGTTRKMTRPQGPAVTIEGVPNVSGVKGGLDVVTGSSDHVGFYTAPEDINFITVSTHTDGHSGKAAKDKDRKRMELRISSPSLGEQILKVQNKETEKGKGEDFRWTGRMSYVITRNMLPLDEIVTVLVNGENDQSMPALKIRRINMTFAEIQFHRLAAARGVPPSAGMSGPMGDPRMAAPNGHPPFPAQVGGPQGQGEPVEQQVGRPQDEPFRKEPFKLKSRTPRPNNDASASGSRRPDGRQVQPAPADDNFVPGPEDDQEDSDEGDNRPATQPRRQSAPRQAPRASREQPRESEEPAASTGRRVSSSTSRVLPRRQGPASCKLVIDLKRSRDENEGQDLTLYVYIEGKFVKRITIGSDESQYTTEVPAGELTVKLGRADAESWIVGKFSAELILPGNTWHVTLKEQ